MVLKGSRHHLRSLKKCRTSPSSKTCRKHVYYSKGIKIKGRDGSFKHPRNGSMTRNTLSRNKRGQIVSKKKSKQGSKRYYRRDSKLRKWNETIAKQLGRHKTFEPLYDPDPSPDDFAPPDDDYPSYVDFTPVDFTPPNDDFSPYVPYVVPPPYDVPPPPSHPP